MYSIWVDTSHAVVEVTLGGMMTVEETNAYIIELKRQLVLNRMRTYAMVIDVSACTIQPQDVIEAMRGHMASMPKARALAVVTGSSLARMQVRRLFTQPYARITSTRDDGRSWARSGIEPPISLPALAARA